MKIIQINEIAKDPYTKNAIIRNDFPGFKEDYLVIHCLIKKYNPKTLIEIGTSSGLGTKVICRAMGIKKYWWNKKKNINKVYSIDVPPGSDPNIIYPGKEDGHPIRAGRKCFFSYTQLFGNSNTFDFSPFYPIEAWFIDGKHNYEYAKKDTIQALKSDPKLIMWHDLQIPEVEQAVVEVMDSLQDKYELYRVEGSRIAFAVLKNI
jgi:hypothetical protein